MFVKNYDEVVRSFVCSLINWVNGLVVCVDKLSVSK